MKSELVKGTKRDITFSIDLLLLVPFYKIYVNLLQMAGVQATIPFRSRKKVYLEDEDVSNENKDILNIRKPSERKLKRHYTEHDLKKSVDEGKIFGPSLLLSVLPSVSFNGTCSGVAAAEAFAQYFASVFLPDPPKLYPENINPSGALNNIPVGLRRGLNPTACRKGD